MVDDNAYRVVLTSSATLADAQRAAIGKHMIEVAKNQKQIVDENGTLRAAEPELLSARAELAQVIGEGVATSEQYIQRRSTAKPFKTIQAEKSAEWQADNLALRTGTVVGGAEATKQIEA